MTSTSLPRMLVVTFAALQRCRIDSGQCRKCREIAANAVRIDLDLNIIADLQPTQSSRSRPDRHPTNSSLALRTDRSIWSPHKPLLKIGDGIAGFAHVVKGEAVTPPATEQRVRCRAAPDIIIAVIAGDQIVALATEQKIAAGRAGDNIVFVGGIDPDIGGAGGRRISRIERRG